MTKHDAATTSTARNCMCRTSYLYLPARVDSVRLCAVQAIRTRVRAVALAWLLCQAASLTAFVPENCCISHVEEQAAKATQDACHETEPAQPEPGDACPMQHGDGGACPMHSSKSSDRCAMSNACDGPGAQLLTLFAYIGATEPPVTTAIDLSSTPAFVRAFTSPLFRISSPDAPPPKA